MLKSKSALFVLPFAFALSACSHNDPGPAAAAAQRHDKPLNTQSVTRDSFINGKTFCNMYSNVKAPEYGKWVTVPKHYEDPSAGTLQLYVYSTTPFDPSLPTYLLVDGGPGQNTHTVPALISGVNQLQFDQRGLGCSTPDTWEIYSDPSLYSSDNTIRDMDEIRKAYGIDQLTVYGISYGTVPATMYGSKFSAHARSVVLEGVVGTLDKIHSPEFKVEKWNLAISSLTAAQRSTLGKLLTTDDEFAELLWGYFSSIIYADDGFESVPKILNVIIQSDGTVNQTVVDQIKQKAENKTEKYSTPQQPMAVDENIFEIVSCKELGYREQTKTVGFDPSAGQFAVSDLGSALSDKRAQECDKLGVKASDQHPYQVTSYPTSQPVYYFQGSHDGACNPEGAFTHWKSVPKGQSYFMLAHHGGHNPNLSRIVSDQTKTEEQDLFTKAIKGEALSSSDLVSINATQSANDSWVLFTKGYDSSVENYLGGI